MKLSFCYNTTMFFHNSVASFFLKISCPCAWNYLWFTMGSEIYRLMKLTLSGNWCNTGTFWIKLAKCSLIIYGDMFSRNFAFLKNLLCSVLKNLSTQHDWVLCEKNKGCNLFNEGKIIFLWGHWGWNIYFHSFWHIQLRRVRKHILLWYFKSSSVSNNFRKSKVAMCKL